MLAYASPPAAPGAAAAPNVPLVAPNVVPPAPKVVPPAPKVVPPPIPPKADAPPRLNPTL